MSSSRIFEILGPGTYPGPLSMYFWIFSSPDTFYSYFIKTEEESHDIIDDTIEPMQWHHMCIGFHGSSGVIEGVLVR